MLKYIAGKLKGLNVISKEEKILLERRYLLNSRYLGIYLHKCSAPDSDPSVFHDHPWSWSFSIILSGNYVEERVGTDRVKERIRRGPLNINFISRDTFHRIAELSPKGAWTLYFRGKKVKKDGFLVQKEDGSWHHVYAHESDYEYTQPV